MATAAPRPGHWARQRGCTYSEACAQCRASADSYEAALLRQHTAAGGGPGTKEAPRRMVMTITGDINGIETLAGHAGASATYNCVLCEARLHETYKAGVPHLRVLPERWASVDKRQPEVINPPPRSGTAEMAECARCYAEACAAPNAPKSLSSGELRFKSCIHTPLFWSDDLLGHTGMAPLHVSLGKGTGYLKAVEARATELDSEWALNVSDMALIAKWHVAQAEVYTSIEATCRLEANPNPVIVSVLVMCFGAVAWVQTLGPSPSGGPRFTPGRTVITALCRVWAVCVLGSRSPGLGVAPRPHERWGYRQVC